MRWGIAVALALGLVVVGMAMRWRPREATAILWPPSPPEDVLPWDVPPDWLPQAGWV